MLFPPKPRELVLGMGAALTQPLLHSSKLLCWQQGGTWMHTEGKYQDTPVPAAPYAFPSHSATVPAGPHSGFQVFNKAFIFPPPPQLVILEIALSEDKVQRWH